MVNIKKNYSLKPHNTFRLNVKAKYFAEVKSEKDIKDLLSQKEFSKEKTLILGKGANILFSQDYNGLIVKVSLKGKKIIKENKKRIVLEAAGGESWPQLVSYTVNQGWGGIENLALVPGTAGAAPVQNIACYGHNFEDSFISLEAIDLNSVQTKNFNKKDCQFSYRSSIFKNELKDHYIITKIRLQLTKNPNLDTSYHSRYESVETELKKIASAPYSVKDLHQAIANIRKNKLPDIKKIGSAGSFFKNPVVSKKKLKQLQKKAPGIQFYPVNKLIYPKSDNSSFNYQDYVKVAAGWLLEEIGWKGKRIGHCGTWDKHALIVVNYGKTTPQELLSFVKKMRGDFFRHYGIWLENEVNII